MSFLRRWSKLSLGLTGRYFPTGVLRKNDYFGPVVSAVEANSLLGGVFFSKAYLAGRIGSVELSCLEHFLKYRLESNIPRPYSKLILRAMRINAGFFPADDDSLDDFCRVYLSAIGEVDMLGVWYNRYENLVAKRFCSNSTLAELRGLEPYYFSDPWTKVLAGKRVLVVHPFIRSIGSQYARRSLLFPNASVLPDFDLELYKPPQTLGSSGGFSTWVEALDFSVNNILELKFDAAIVGAGAYGLPISAAIKRSGRSVVHLGGATQILFGIRGTRWDDHSVISKMYNEHWIRPSLDERPDVYMKVENGAYW